MLCQKCGVNQASVHFVQVLNGVRTEQHICSKCAGQDDIIFSAGHNLNKLVSNFFQPSFEEVRRCPTCGSTFKEFSKTGLFGCGECYNAFDEQLEEPLKRLHGANSHCGKKPPEEQGVTDLKEQLKRAIADENYELAAQLRDRIKELASNDQKG